MSGTAGHRQELDQAGLAKLDLVTRKVCETQRAELLKTREKLDALKTAVRELDSRWANC